MTRVVFALIPGVHILDLAGPAQVFSTADDLGHEYRLLYVADSAEVPTAQAVTLQAQTRWPDLAVDDLILVPGWRQSTPPSPVPISAAMVDHMRRHHARGGTVASVCSGAFALGFAGLLDGRRCTTHHELTGALERHYRHATVIRDVLYVVDGRVITSAGIASGIDLSLHLIAVRHGPSVAARIARSMVVYTRRNGDDLQTSAMLRHRTHLSDVAHQAQDVVDARFAEPLRLTELAIGCGVSERTLTRLFTSATGMTPLRYQQTLRLERAEHLIGQGWTVAAAARSVGFTDARMLRRLRARARGDRSTADVSEHVPAWSPG